MPEMYPNILFHNLILENSLEFGNRPALVHEGQTIVFNEISSIVSKLVQKLVSMNVSMGDTILICLPNSIWHPLLFLACAKIGAIMSGISAESTETEIRYFITQSGAKFIFTNQFVSNNKQWLEQEISVVVLPTMISEYCEELSENVKPNEENSSNSSIDSILLAPFSSGTTGLPKCCQLTHRNFLASTFSLKKALFDELLKNSSKKTLAFLPFHHASGFWALLLCLLEGCTTYIMSQFHPMLMMDMIEKYEIDTINIIPSIANIFLKIGFIDNRCPTLRTILCGASGLSKERCKRFLSLFPQVINFIQGYGMTELVVLSHITPFGDNLVHLGSCGKLIPGFESKFLIDEDGDKELLLKSDAIMKFYKNGKSNLSDDGWLHTGDIVEERDGFFYIIDRKKDLIKVNGFQVSPSEIEEHILAFPNVSEVAVIGIDDELCGQLPKAFVVLEENTDELLFLKNIEHILKGKLSAVKQLRGGITITKEMPKSASGKIQKNKLKSIP